MSILSLRQQSDFPQDYRVLLDELGLKQSFSNSQFTSSGLIDCTESQEKTSNNTDSSGRTATIITIIIIITTSACLLCALRYVNVFNSPSNTRSQLYLFPPFSNEETQV